MSDEFAALLEREGVATLLDTLHRKQDDLQQIRARLYHNVHDNYHVLKTAGNALVQIHERLSETTNECASVIKKMESMEQTKVTFSCAEFDELATTLQDNLSQSLHTIWIEPGFDADRLRFVQDSPKQWNIGKAPKFVVKEWVDAAESFSLSVTRSQHSDIRSHMLQCLEAVRIDEHALNNSRTSQFSHIVKKLAEDPQLIANILLGYSAYARSHYLEPLQVYADSAEAIISPCASLVLYSLLGVRIMLDLHKLQSALSPDLADNYLQETFSFSDTFLATDLLSTCSARADLTTASLKLFMRVADTLKVEFPNIERVHTRSFAHTICHVVYQIFAARAMGVFRNLTDIANEERGSVVNDVVADIGIIQHLMHSSCSSPQHRLLVGEILYTYLKLLWIGFLLVSGSVQDYEALIAEEVTSVVNDSTHIARQQNEAAPNQFDITPPLVSNMLKFREALASDKSLQLNVRQFTNRERAAYLETIDVFFKVEESARMESLVFGLDNWNCRALNSALRFMQGEQRNELTRCLSEQIAKILVEGLTAVGINQVSLSANVVEPVAAVISQVNYFCIAPQSPQKGDHEDGRSSSGVEFLECLTRACENNRISSLRIEALVRSPEDLKTMAQKHCKDRWREQVVLEGFMNMISALHTEGTASNWDDQTKIWLIWTLVKLCDFVIPAGPRESFSKSADSLQYLCGMINAICVKTDALDHFDRIVTSCKSMFEGQGR